MKAKAKPVRGDVETSFFFSIAFSFCLHFFWGEGGGEGGGGLFCGQAHCRTVKGAG